MICQKHVRGYVTVCLDCHKEKLTMASNASHALLLQLVESIGVAECEKRLAASAVEGSLRACVSLAKSGDLGPEATNRLIVLFQSKG